MCVLDPSDEEHTGINDIRWDEGRPEKTGFPGKNNEKPCEYL